MQRSQQHSSRAASTRRRPDGHYTVLHHPVPAANLSFKDNVLTIPGYKFNEAKRWNDTGSSTLLATGFNLKTGSHVLAKIAPAHSNSAICLGREVIINNQLSSMPEGTRIALSLVEALTIPKLAGDCEVVIYLHPGTNALGRYFPSGAINDLLLPWQAQPVLSLNTEDKKNQAKRERIKRSLYELGMPDYEANMDNTEYGDMEETEDLPTSGGEEPNTNADMDLDENAPANLLTSPPLPEQHTNDDSNEAWDIMDLASFLEFAINSTHCLEILHKSGHKHREVRANAFHINIHSGAVRFAHFGNRSESLEKTGGPSQLVLRASGLIPGDDGKILSDISDSVTEGQSEIVEFVDTRRVKEAICYLAPEQTGTAETNNEDHRTDLYALGVLFWALLVGHGSLPFDGNPVEMLHKVVQTKPREVHEVRRDIPPVISAIIAKLLAKSPDARYNSAIGLKNDLMECQKRLQLSCATTEASGNTGLSDIDLIPSFELGEHDMFLELTIPGDLFGRDKEIQQMRNVIRNVAATAAAQVHSVEGSSSNFLPRTAQALQLIHSNGSFPNNASNASLAVSNVSVGYSNTSYGDVLMNGDGPGDSTSTVNRAGLSGAFGNTSPDPSGSHPMSNMEMDLQNGDVISVPSSGTPDMAEFSPNVTMPAYGQNIRSTTHKSASVGTNTPQARHTHTLSLNSHSLGSSSNFSSSLAGSGGRGNRAAQAHAIIVCGPAGIGKSSLIQVHQANWRRQGLWGHAKMVKGQASPFTGLLTCLSSVLRQLMMFQNDRYMFVSLLKARLNMQITNVPLLYNEVPELRDILGASGIHLVEPKVEVSTEELGARFQNLVECVYATLADVRLLALFLDDLHFADKSTLDLIGLLADSKSRILILTTCRNDDPLMVNRVRQIFTSRARTTWIDLSPLDSESLGSLVSLTLQRSKQDVITLSRLVARVSLGNPFQARNLLQTVWRQGHIWFDWGTNMWQYNLEAIEKSVHVQQLVAAPTDISFLVAHFKDLSEEAQKYLIWASIFGPTFKTNDVSNMMDGELLEDERDDFEGNVKEASGAGSSAASEINESSGIDVVPPMIGYSKPSLRGLQQALAQGWLIQRARDMCSFTHDKYRQAATHMASQQPDIVVMKMCLAIASHLMQEPERDVFRITEYARRCIPLIREDPHREEFVNCLIEAAESSAARGAHELALQAYKDARTLLGEGSLHDLHEQAQDLTLKLAELYGSQGSQDASNQLIVETLLYARKPEDRAHALRLRGRNRFVQRDFDGAYRDSTQALEIMGVKIPPQLTLREVDEAFDDLKAKLLRIGFDELLNINRTNDQRADLIISLMNDAANNAGWGAPAGMADYIGITIINMALRDGISPGSALGLFWCLGGAAERRQLYRLCADLGKLALQMVYKFGNSIDKGRCETLYSTRIAGYAPEHIRTCIQRSNESLALTRSAGDRIYEGFAQCSGLSARLFCSEHLSDLKVIADEAVTDIRIWTVNSDTNALAMGILMTIRALAGDTHARNADTAFDTDKWKEAHFLHKLHESSGNLPLVMNWYNSFKISGLYGLGFHSRAAELGFEIYSSRGVLPSHRHIRYGLFFHSLAMIQCLRHGGMPQSQQSKYLQQLDINQQHIRAWVSPSPVNNSAWHALIEAEMASLRESPDAFKLYDNAIKMSVNHDWVMEEAWALYLEGAHFLRCGVESLGTELQARGIARHRQWGAYGIVNNLSRGAVLNNTTPLKRNIFSAEAGVQTDESEITEALRPDHVEEIVDTNSRAPDDSISMLTAADLSDILKWAQAVSSDINLVSSLQRLTEIATRQSQAQESMFAMRTDEGDYTVVTNCTPPQPCIVYEQPKSIRRIGDPLKRAVLQHCLNSRTRVFFADTSSEPRFVQEAGQSVIRSVICLPFSNNRGQTYGALFLGSQYPFTQTNLSILSLLCQQASISIANAMLFRSVQQATKANLQMIQSQRQALEEARASREAAMKATKIKSNFLASMSHELRTPFSSFYGLLDILGTTPLDSNQRDLVQTAKQSCELLLKIIDSILDYSKLEASALKLEPVPFLVEDVVADCVELLLPLAAQKLDLSFDIAPEVPIWAIGDYSRIRQVIMNLLANALKFTEHGSVSTVCTVDPSIPCEEDEIVLKWTVQDTGIGMSETDMKNLWQPFSQADNSSTRRFGGTGLGLSISLSLVKLMGGDIGAVSEPHVGSRFWFHIPIKVHQSEETRKSEAQQKALLQKLRDPRPLRILVSSPSPITLSLLSTLLLGFELTRVSTFEQTIAQLEEAAHQNFELDFVILDHSGQDQLEEISRILDKHSTFVNTKAIHLYTPTPLAIPRVGGLLRKSSASREPTLTNGTIEMALASVTGFDSTSRQDEKILSEEKLAFLGRIVRMNKPPRRARLLRLLANLKDIQLPNGGFSSAQIEQALESMETTRAITRTATVLIAEDNPVANKLLVKQLQKYDITVVSTVDGSEAVKEWEKRPAGYFNFALFDHHMPVCDGVEAAKRIRAIETRRKVKIHLPIIALSADCQESTKELCLSAGMSGFLTKPIRAGDLPNLLKVHGTPKSAS